MPSKYKKSEIPKGMEHLFEKDISGRRDDRVYKFIGATGKIEEHELAKDEELRPFRCPVDGCFIVQYIGDPHNYTECPCCGKDFEEDGLYTIKKYKEDLERETKRIETELVRNRGLLELLENPNHPTILANKQNSLHKE